MCAIGASSLEEEQRARKWQEGQCGREEGGEEVSCAILGEMWKFAGETAMEADPI